jgi:hypothetical protein
MLWNNSILNKNSLKNLKHFKNIFKSHFNCPIYIKVNLFYFIFYLVASLFLHVIWNKMGMTSLRLHLMDWGKVQCLGCNVLLYPKHWTLLQFLCTPTLMPITINVIAYTKHNMKISWMVHHVQTKVVMHLQWKQESKLNTFTTQKCKLTPCTKHIIICIQQ